MGRNSIVKHAGISNYTGIAYADVKKLRHIELITRIAGATMGLYK
jgi:hypothetical protein